MTTPENTPLDADPAEQQAPDNPEVEVTGYSVPPNEDPDNPEERRD
ncbi:hypothetical protein AB0H71_21720 [Nocardia sp. NPDC050697]